MPDRRVVLTPAQVETVLDALRDAFVYRDGSSPGDRAKADAYVRLGALLGASVPQPRTSPESFDAIGGDDDD